MTHSKQRSYYQFVSSQEHCKRLASHGDNLASPYGVTRKIEIINVMAEYEPERFNHDKPAFMVGSPWPHARSRTNQQPEILTDKARDLCFQRCRLREFEPPSAHRGFRKASPAIILDTHSDLPAIRRNE